MIVNTVDRAALPLENVTNDAPLRIEESMLEVGANCAQGDLYFVRIAGLPASAKPRKNRQLVNDDTQGSRHVCEVGDVFDADADEMRRLLKRVAGEDVQAQYIGPVVQTVNGTAEVTHPEHGDHRYVGDMCLAVVFQRSLDGEEREARVRD